jgi:hypothetical protein
MSRAWLLILVAAAGCRSGTPSARLEATRLEATRPELVLLQCRASGFPARPKFSWKLPGGVRTSGVPPLDHGSLLVQLADNLRHAELVECTATSEGNLTATAELALGPITVSSAKVEGSLLTVEGSGFGAKAGTADGVWLVPARGRALATLTPCKGASWSETKIVACLPATAQKPYQVRVQSGGRLGLGPPLNLPVAK